MSCYRYEWRETACAGKVREDTGSENVSLVDVVELISQLIGKHSENDNRGSLLMLDQTHKVKMLCIMMRNPILKPLGC